MKLVCFGIPFGKLYSKLGCKTTDSKFKTGHGVSLEAAVGGAAGVVPPQPSLNIRDTSFLVSN